MSFDAADPLTTISAQSQPPLTKYVFCHLYIQLWVGVMLQTQPFFIGGIEDVDLARESAFGAMGMFLVCFVLSAVGIWYDSQYKVEPSTTEPEAEYHLSNDGIATYGTST